jgi:hypothetical protein
VLHEHGQQRSGDKNVGCKIGVQQRFDASGSRPTPAFPEPGGACIAAYGDSFTYGSGVSDTDAFPNRLSQLFGCRVANYGVPGYGSDQATLRFEEQHGDPASIVILTHLSENVVRNLNRYRKLIASGERWGMKPRFALQPNGELRLLPMPETLEPTDYLEIVRDPEAHLADDFFLPGGASGIQRLRFPFTPKIVLALRHYHVQAELRGVPFYEEFYSLDHEAGGVELTARIFARFAAGARERGAIPLIQIMPTALDLLEYQESGRWVYESLERRAGELGIDVVNLGQRLMSYVGKGDPCRIYQGCNFHLNEVGNELVARHTAIAIDERHLRHEVASQGRWPEPIRRVDPEPTMSRRARP